MNKRMVLISIFTAMAAAAQEPYRDPGMRKIVQVAMVCKDVAACSARWANVLGMPVPKITTTRPGHEVQVMYRGKPSEGQAKLAFFQTGQTVIELIEPVGQGTSWKEGLDQNGEGVHHLGFQVEDLDKTIAAFEKEGMPVVHRGRYDSDNGTYVYLDTRDKLGVTIELLHSDPKPTRK
jgi:catechol 2,3-dioxygenase-like lactoylglutathione lyase family enzyme